MITIVTLVLAGAFLLVLETVLPGMVAGLAGLALLVAGIVVAYADFGPQTGHLVLLIVVVGLIVGTLLWMKYFPASRFAQIFVSKSQVGELNLSNDTLVNQTGIAQTNLRPSGTAVIGSKRVDVVTEGPLIERGRAVRVVAVEGMRVIVRAL